MFLYSGCYFVTSYNQNQESNHAKYLWITSAWGPFSGKDMKYSILIILIVQNLGWTLFKLIYFLFSNSNMANLTKIENSRISKIQNMHCHNMNLQTSSFDGFLKRSLSFPNSQLKMFFWNFRKKIKEALKEEEKEFGAILI